MCSRIGSSAYGVGPQLISTSYSCPIGKFCACLFTYRIRSLGVSDVL
uniref:Uncharacterized protein n=1 Tax=Arundo donax TaxID=35708 RepID=A0A0A9RHF5_ARUDO